MRLRADHVTAQCLPEDDEITPINYAEGSNCQFRILYLFFKKIHLFIYFWLHWVFVAARGLSSVAASRSYSSLRCTGSSLQWLLLLRSMGSRHAGFSSCGTRAQLLRGMWDLPRLGLDPTSPALAGGFLTNAPPGKPQNSLSYLIYIITYLLCYFVLLIIK